MASSISEDLFISRVERVGLEVRARIARAHQVLHERETALLSELQGIVNKYKGEGLAEQILELSLSREQSKSTLQRNENKETLDLNVTIIEARIAKLETELFTARGRILIVELEWENELDEYLSTIGTISVQGIPDYTKKDKPIKTAGKHTEAPTSIPLEFRLPNSVAIEPKSKNIFICDGGNSRVQVFSNSLEFIFSFSENMRVPFGICIHRDEVYVTQVAMNSLTVYSTKGEFIQTVGKKGNGELEFYQPRGIAISSVNNQIYICEKKNNRIQCLNLDLTFMAFIHDILKPLDVKLTSKDIIILKRWNPNFLFYNYLHQLVRGSTDWAFNELVRKPCTFCLDAESNILMADYSTDCIVVFSKKGERLLSLGGRGDRRGEFLEPVGVALESGNIIVVSRNPTHCIQKF